jgi:hypothetical protein
MTKMIREWLHEIYASERGDTLILALIVMILAGLLIGPLLSHMSTGLKNTREVYSARTIEQYAADAGVSQALWYIKYRSDDVPGEFSLENINTKTVFVNISGTPDEDNSITYTIVSRAGSTTTTAVVGYTPEIEAVPEIPGEDPYLYFSKGVETTSGNIAVTGSAAIKSDSGKNGDVFSSGGVNITGSSSIAGDVYAVSNISLGYSTKIDGNAVASGTVSTSGTVTGTRTSSAALQAPVLIDDHVLNTLVQGVYDETHNIGPLTPGGTTYNSDLTIMNKSNIHYPEIYVKGNLIFSNTNTNIVFDGQVYVTGNICFKSGTQNLTFSSTVYAGGQIYAESGSGTIRFSNLVIANGINLPGSYSYTFHGNVKDLGDFTSGNSTSTAFDGTVYVGGNFSYSGSSNMSVSHNIYIKGNLVMGNSNQIIGPQKVVVRGNATLSGSAMLTAAQLPFIIIPPARTTPALGSMVDPSSVTVANSAAASAAVYAPTADFIVTGSGKLRGGIVCKSATISNSAIVEYLVGVDGRNDFYSPGTPGTPGIDGSPASWGLNTWNIH